MVSLRGAGVPFATLTFTQRRPTTPSLSLFAKFSPVIEVAKFSKSAASGLEMTSIRGAGFFVTNYAFFGA